MRKPTDTLREEHRVILRAIALLEVAVGRLTDGRPLPEGWWETLLDWLRSFADLNHHAKEETHLFPALAQAGVPATGGPVSVMLEEHTAGRGLVQAMAHGHVDRRVEAARRYAHLLRDHIDKENGVLLPLADAVLDSQSQLRLARAFEEIDAGQGRAASLNHAEAGLERLATRLGD